MKGFKLYFFNTSAPISEFTGNYSFATEGDWILLSEFNENSSVTNTFDEVLHEEENSRYTLDFKIVKKSNWVGSLPNNFNFSDFIKIGRKLKLELDPNRKIFLTITNISPEGYGDNIIFNIQAVDFASYVFARNSTGLTFNSRTDEEFLEWLEYNYPGEKSTADRIIEYILIRGSLYDKKEGKGWSVSTTNDPEHPLKQNIGIELSSSNTYNALVEVALITNSFLVVDFITKKIGLTRRDDNSFRKNFILSPEFNLQELSLTYNSENFYPILYGIGGEDDRGLVVGLIPTLSFSQYRSLDKYDENFDPTRLVEYYEDPNFYNEVDWEGEDPDSNTIDLLNRIPYLDTFIMDLSYFLEYELILEEDYQYIINKIFNELRKINIKFQKVFMMKSMLENQIISIENEIDIQTRTVNIAEDSNYIGDNEKLESLYFQEGGGLIPQRNTISLLENINEGVENFNSKTLVDLSSGGYTFYEVTQDAYNNYFSIATESGGGGYDDWELDTPLDRPIKYHSNGKYYVSGPFVQQYPLELTFTTSDGHSFLNNFQAKNEWGPIIRDVENYDFAPFVSSPTLYQFKSNMINNKNNLNSTFWDLFGTEPIVLDTYLSGSNQPLLIRSFTNNSLLNFTSGSACVVEQPRHPDSEPGEALVYNFYNNGVYRYDGYGVAGGCSAPFSKWTYVGQLSSKLNPFQFDRIYTLSSEYSSKNYIWSSPYSTEIGYLQEIKNIKSLFMKKAATSRGITTNTNYTDPYSDIRIENSGLMDYFTSPVSVHFEDYILYNSYYLNSDESFDHIYLGFRLRKDFPGTNWKNFTQINFPDGKKNWLVFGSVRDSFPRESEIWSKIEKISNAGVIDDPISLSGLSIGSNYTVSCTFTHPEIHLGYRVGGIIRFVHPSDSSIFYEGVLEESLNPDLHYIVNLDEEPRIYFNGHNIKKSIESSNITIKITKISNINQNTQARGWTVVAPFLESDKHILLTSKTSGTATVRELYWQHPNLSSDLTAISDPFTYEMNNATILLNKSQSDTIYSLHKYHELLIAYKGLYYTQTKKLEDLKNDYIEAILEKNKIISEINAGKLAPEELASLESTLSGYRKLVGNSDYDSASEELFHEEGQNTDIQPSKLGELGLKYFNYLKYLNLYLENNEVNPDKGSIYDSYMKLKEEKQKLWFDLKEKFGDFLIEGYYENETENDSYSLFLQTLENSKDYFKLAEDYSLTYLDGSQIIGKDLDLIEVGDFIKIRGEKLGVINNEKNEVQVSAISRELRDFSNITLTVNKIKTNSNLIEKLLSSVAKK